MLRSMIAAVILVVAFLSGCTNRDDAAGAEQKEAPNFTLQDIEGRNVSLSDHKGKVVLIEFWATWCAPCRASIPGLERLYKAYGDKGFTVLAISLDYGELDSVRQFRAEYGITYPVLQGTDEIAIKYRVRSIPMLVLADRDGKVRNRYLGAADDDVLEKDIKPLL